MDPIVKFSAPPASLKIETPGMRASCGIPGQIVAENDQPRLKENRSLEHIGNATEY
jgi:hypothetical protein